MCVRSMQNGMEIYPLWAIAILASNWAGLSNELLNKASLWLYVICILLSFGCVSLFYLASARACCTTIHTPHKGPRPTDGSGARSSGLACVSVFIACEETYDAHDRPLAVPVWLLFKVANKVHNLPTLNL